MPVIYLSPLSPPHFAAFPQVLESSGVPPEPKPILESGERQSFWSLARKPILALAACLLIPSTLKPSLLQLLCKDASDPISVFHVSRPSVVARYCPSEIRECRELACLLMRTNLIFWPIFIPRQILVNGVFQ